MKIIKNENKDSVLTVILEADKTVFDEAREQAYKEFSSSYPVPGFVNGEADLSQLKRTYGPAVLYDEALQILVPDIFNQYLNENHIRIMGKPKVNDVSFENDGSVRFTIEAQCFPELIYGPYKGVQVKAARNNDELFEKEVFDILCSQVQGRIPDHMVNQKLDSMLAQEKIKVADDAIYHLLADTLALLKKGYSLAGISRPMDEMRAQAMDIMLQTVSFENQQMPEKYLLQQIAFEAGRYRELPEDFNDSMNQAMAERKKEKADMKPEERIDEVFNAYLGSIGLTEQTWREESMKQAVHSVLTDLVLDHAAEEENLSVSKDEINNEYRKIANQYGVEVENVIEQIQTDLIKWQLLRRKAKQLILASAVSTVS